VVLAGHLQTIHEGCMNLKNQYLTYRRHVLGESSDVFKRNDHEKGERQKELTGPSPFTGRTPLCHLLLPPTTLGTGFQGNIPTTGLSFGGSLGLGSNMNSSAVLNKGSFNLQNPPPGHKRSKR